MEKGNLVKSEKFSEKLKMALNKYRNQAITNAEVVEELIKMANEMKKDVENEKDLGMNRDEAAFYYALTAVIRKNITIDWSIRKSAQAGMRRIIKRLLKKYDYPPKQAKSALKIVMKQAELMCGNVESHAYSGYGKVAEDEGYYKI